VGAAGSASVYLVFSTGATAGAVLLVSVGAAGATLVVSFFLMIGFAIAAVGLGVPTAVAAGPGPVKMLAIFGTISPFFFYSPKLTSLS